MDLHYGEVVERAIRRNGYSISELARMLNVNRRSVYNWFNQRNLKPELIYRIGCALRHDFSEEFPHLFTKEDFSLISQAKALRVEKTYAVEGEDETEQHTNLWKTKYIVLLEEYNDLLMRNLKSTQLYLSHQ